MWKSKASAVLDRPSQTLDNERIADFSPSWCQQLLNDPTYEHLGLNTRIAHNSEGASKLALMGKTLFTDGTFRAIRYMYRPKDPNDEQALGGELIALVSVGNDMCSHLNVLHGGINATLVDEIGGALAMKEAPLGTVMMAVNFNVNLRKSVRTPGVLMGRAWFEKTPQGRKFWVKCTIEQDGATCIDAECMYLKINFDTSKL